MRGSIRPQFDVLTGILREMLPEDTAEEQLHLTAFSIVGQCLFYHFADSVVHNLVGDNEYNDYDVNKLAAHIATFSLNALERNTPSAVAARGSR